MTWKERLERAARPYERMFVEFAVNKDKLDEREFEGLASKFNSLVQGWVPTIIEPGSFKKTLKENKGRIPLLWQHDPGQPVGMPIAMKETDEGLWLHGSIDDTSWGEDAIKSLRSGTVQGLSIGFDPLKWEMITDKKKKDEPIRHVKEVKLWEVSLVTFAADPKARIGEVHGMVDEGYFFSIIKYNLEAFLDAAKDPEQKYTCSEDFRESAEDVISKLTELLQNAAEPPKPDKDKDSSKEPRSDVPPDASTPTADEVRELEAELWEMDMKTIELNSTRR